MNTCIFVPSHIHHSEQIELLNKCLSSLINQTQKTKIWKHKNQPSYKL